jgi:hypothetical protein
MAGDCAYDFCRPCLATVEAPFLPKQQQPLSPFSSIYFYQFSTSRFDACCGTFANCACSLNYHLVFCFILVIFVRTADSTSPSGTYIVPILQLEVAWTESPSGCSASGFPSFVSSRQNWSTNTLKRHTCDWRETISNHLEKS